MSEPLSLQQKFEMLLGETTAFFSADHAEPQQDRAVIDRLRTLALSLASEAQGRRRFERFLAFLLGTNWIEAHYSLHAIQMMCLVAHALRGLSFKPGERDELLTAAFFADFGLRAAWMSVRQDHPSATALHLKGFHFPWWSLTLERYILNHQDPAADVSPTRILSIVARFLWLTRGTGDDTSPEVVILPAKAVDQLMEDTALDAEGKRRFVNSVSTFPLGSWVRLNSGETGLIVGNAPGNPLRPIVTLWHQDGGPAGGPWYSDIDLKAELTRFVSGDALPSAGQDSIFRHPALWIPDFDNPLAPQADVEPAELDAAPLPPVPAPVAESDSITAAIVIPSHAVLPESVEPPPAIVREAASSATAATDLARSMAVRLSALEQQLKAWRADVEEVPLADDESWRILLEELRVAVAQLRELQDPAAPLLEPLLDAWSTPALSAAPPRLVSEAQWAALLQNALTLHRQVDALSGGSVPASELEAATRQWNDVLVPAMETFIEEEAARMRQRRREVAAALVARSERQARARRLLALAIEKAARAALGRGIRARREGDPSESVASFERALSILPPLPEARLYLDLARLQA